MKLILCADDELGIGFHGRRQSRDRNLTEKLLQMTAGETLLVCPGSAALFPQGTVLVCENPMESAQAGQWCFYEQLPDLEDRRIEVLLLCRWNRRYPADIRLALPAEWKMRNETEITGYSHDKITLQTYERG